MPTPQPNIEFDPRLAGVIAPLVSNFDASGEALDLPAFAANIEAHLRNGVSGVLVAGSTGEAALLDEEERLVLVQAARVAVPSDRMLLVGVGGESTKVTIRRIRAAAELGADAVLVVSPHYYTASMTRAALLQHFSRVADASPVPVLLYNIPKYAHFALAPDLVEELAGNANIVGIKDSSGDLELLSGYIAVQRRIPRFTVLTGSGPTFQPALEIGARGGILAVSLFTGELAPRLHSAWMRGEGDEARALHQDLATPGKEIVGGLGVPGVKAAMDFCGLVGGAVRSPLLSLEERQLDRVRELLRPLAESTPSMSN